MAFIPGLTSHHFTSGSHNSCNTPVLKSSRIHDDGETFDFEWTVRGSKGETYNLWASGNVLERKRDVLYGAREWWGFSCGCSCPNFCKQEHATHTQEPGYQENYVCKHLNAALESVTDDGASLNALEEDAFIPGLTSDHFINGGRPACHEPCLTQADIDYDDGEFYLKWEVKASYEDEHYELWASGNIVLRELPQGNRRWWGFRCGCSCPNFATQQANTLACGETENYVCKHLSAALESVVEE